MIWVIAIAALLLGVVTQIDRYWRYKDIISLMKRMRALEDKVKLMDRR